LNANENNKTERWNVHKTDASTMFPIAIKFPSAIFSVSSNLIPFPLQKNHEDISVLQPRG